MTTPSKSQIPVIARHKRVVAFKWSLFSAAILPGVLCKWRLKAGLSSLGHGDVPTQSVERGAISRPSILLTATDSELQLASTSSLFLESSSASTSFEVAPTKTRQQKDEVSAVPRRTRCQVSPTVAVKPLGTSAGTATCSNG